MNRIYKIYRIFRIKKEREQDLHSVHAGYLPNLANREAVRSTLCPYPAHVFFLIYHNVPYSVDPLA